MGRGERANEPEPSAFFADHGWWVSGQLLSPAELDDLTYEIERYAAGEQDHVLPSAILPRWSGAPERGVRQADYLSLQLDRVLDFIRKPLLPRIAASMMGVKSVRLFHDQLVWKDGATSELCDSSVGWHTDRAYWQSCTSAQMITAWIPLQDTNEQMGPLAFWDGSHLWPEGDDLHSFDQSDLSSIEAKFRAFGREIKVVQASLRRGQVSFHHCRLIHGSYSNRSERRRLGLAIHYQDGGNRHVSTKAGTDTPKVHLNDLLCRIGADGLPDYSDPNVCPLLWSAEDQG